MIRWLLCPFQHLAVEKHSKEWCIYQYWITNIHVLASWKIWDMTYDTMVTYSYLHAPSSFEASLKFIFIVLEVVNCHLIPKSQAFWNSPMID